VPGAWEDCVRIGNLINRLGKVIDDIKLTLDSHHQLHIAHPMWFKDVKTGKCPTPFTVMREENNRIIGAQFNSNAGKW